MTFLRTFWSITEEQRSYGYLTEDGATEHTANYFNNVSITVFEDRMISCPQGLPDFNASDFYLWENLKKKNKIYSNDPHTLDAFKQLHLLRSVNSN
jgi:hypothetical protein